MGTWIRTDWLRWFGLYSISASASAVLHLIKVNNTETRATSAQVCWHGIQSLPLIKTSAFLHESVEHPQLPYDIIMAHSQVRIWPVSHYSPRHKAFLLFGGSIAREFPCFLAYFQRREAFRACECFKLNWQPMTIPSRSKSAIISYSYFWLIRDAMISEETETHGHILQNFIQCMSYSQ